MNSFINLSAGRRFDAQMLRPGDVFLVGKGNRHFAWCYDLAIGQALASSNFFILHPRMDLINPHFLALYLNLPQTLENIRALSSGTNIASIKKTDLLELTIAVPPLETQNLLLFDNFNG